MIESIKNKIASVVLKRLINSRPTKEISFNNFFEKAERILLIMPVDDNDLRYAASVIQFLRASAKELSVFIAEHRVSLMGNLKDINYITFGLDDFTKLKLPSPRLKNLLVEKSFDIVIDLNGAPDRFFNAVAAYSNSEISVGCKAPNSDVFYNFQIPKEINTKKTYENLLNSLNMF